MKTTHRILLMNLAVLCMVVLFAFVVGRAVFQMVKLLGV